MKLETPLDSHIQNCLVLPWYPNFGNWPNYVGDSPSASDIDPYFGRVITSPNANSEKFYIPAVVDKQVWFPEPDGAYKFELEVPRYSQNEISVSIEDDGIKTLVVFGEQKVGESSRCFTEKYAIPSESLDLENSSAKVENGLLTVFFPKKFVTAKTIKVL